MAETHLSFDSEHRLRAENLSWDIDVWYPMVKDYTFRTVFIPLTVDEAESIRAYHDVSWRHLRPRLTRQEVHILQRLEQEIDKRIQNHFGNRGAFVRLCGRSPKDGEPLDRDNVRSQYRANLQSLLDDGAPADTHTKMMAIARTSYLHVRSGAEAMSLLLTSERVYADMIDWLRFGEPEQVCLREWWPELSMDMELRVFVCDGRITAASQYDHYAFYPHLHTMRDRLRAGIEEVWRQVHPLLGLQQYVMDVGCLSHTSSHAGSGAILVSGGDERGGWTDSWVVIEFSPFFACTGPALFSWGDDLALLEGKTSAQDSFELRLKEEKDVHPQLPDLLECNWDDRWNQPTRPYTHLYDTNVNSDPQESFSLCVHRHRIRSYVYALCIAVLGASSVGIFAVLIFIGLLQLESSVCVRNLLLWPHPLTSTTASSTGSGMIDMDSVLPGRMGEPGGDNALLGPMAPHRYLQRMVEHSVGLAVLLLCVLSYLFPPWQKYVPHPAPTHVYTPSLPTHISTTGAGSWGARYGGERGKDGGEEVCVLSGYHFLFVYGTLKKGFHWNSKYLHQRATLHRDSSVGIGSSTSGWSSSDSSNDGQGEWVTPAVFVGEALTCTPHRLVVGSCGVPYLCLGSDQPAAHATTSNCEGNKVGTEDLAAAAVAAKVVGSDPLLGLDGVLRQERQAGNIERVPLTIQEECGTTACTVSGELWLVSETCLRGLDEYEGVLKGYYQRTLIEVNLLEGHGDTQSVVLANVYHLPHLPEDLARGPFLHKYTLEMHRQVYNPVQHIMVKQLSYIKKPSAWGTGRADSASGAAGAGGSVTLNKGMQNVAH